MGEAAPVSLLVFGGGWLGQAVGRDVVANGGTIVNSNPWGLKSLAYPIQKKTTGMYWVVEFTASSDFNEKLKIQLLRDESVLRHLLCKLDKYAVEYNKKKRSGVPTGNEKAVEV